MVTIPLSLILIGLIIIQVFIPGFPKEALLLSSGLNYGLVWGTMINWVGMILAAQVGYEVVLHSVKVGGRFATILEQYEESEYIKRLETKGNFGLFFIRLIPYAPNDVLSLLSGAILLPRKGFILVSIVTALPYAIVFAYLGDLGSDIIDPTWVWIMNFGLFVLSLTVLLVRYLMNKSRLTVN